MIKRLLLLLILLIPIGGYLWYRQTPEQQLGRTVNQFLENIEHQRITSRRKVDVHESLKKVLAPKINFQGNWPIPSEELTLEEVIAKIDLFHSISILCEITTHEQNIQIIGNKAQVILNADILVAAVGKNNKDEQLWELIFDLEKKEDWRIIGIRGSRP